MSSAEGFVPGTDKAQLEAIFRGWDEQNRASTQASPEKEKGRSCLESLMYIALFSIGCVALHQGPAFSSSLSWGVTGLSGAMTLINLKNWYQGERDCFALLYCIASVALGVLCAQRVVSGTAVGGAIVGGGLALVLRLSCFCCCSCCSSVIKTLETAEEAYNEEGQYGEYGGGGVPRRQWPSEDLRYQRCPSSRGEVPDSTENDVSKKNNAVSKDDVNAVD